MTTPAQTAVRFRRDMLAGLDEPVQRYLLHAIRDGAVLPQRTRLTMDGHIKVGAWLPFTAEQETELRSFVWKARVGAGPLTVLRVTDQYADGSGSMEGRLFGRLRCFRADDAHTTRSASGRAGFEAATLAPHALLTDDRVSLVAESDDRIVAGWDIGSEHPQVHIRIDEHGAVRATSGVRWGKVGRGGYGYLPFGCEVHDEKRFGDFLLPASLTVGWWFGTPRYAPFFRADIVRLSPADRS